MHVNSKEQWNHRRRSLYYPRWKRQVKDAKEAERIVTRHVEHVININAIFSADIHVVGIILLLVAHTRKR